LAGLWINSKTLLFTFSLCPQAQENDNPLGGDELDLENPSIIITYKTVEKLFDITSCSSIIKDRQLAVILLPDSWGTKAASSSPPFNLQGY